MFANAFIDATFRRMQAQVKEGKGNLYDMMNEVFGDEAEQVRRDIAAGNMTRDVKYLLFSELSDTRPTSIAEMPINYLNQPNGRIFYMLKTYALKQIDAFRREAFDDIFSGDMKKAATGFRRLLALSACLLLSGMPGDELKAFLLGRTYDLSDLVIDNILKLFGFSKWTIYAARRDAEYATWSLFIPPLATPWADLSKDVDQIIRGKETIADSRVLGHTPIVGKFYYWWFGGGAEKRKKEQ